MTARRQNSATAAAAAFGRALTPKTTKTAGQTPDTGKAAAPPATASKTDDVKPSTSKYTLLLTQEDALLWDRVLIEIRSGLGRRVDKSELVRVLVALAADDPTLRAQVVDELRARAEAARAQAEPPESL